MICLCDSELPIGYKRLFPILRKYWEKNIFIHSSSATIGIIQNRFLNINTLAGPPAQSESDEKN